MRLTALLVSIVTLVLAVSPGEAQQTRWVDPSPHSVALINVEDDVRLEVLNHHSVSERLTVISGTLCFTTGTETTRSDSTCIGPGTFRLMPAGIVHTDWATGPVEYQIDAVGPFDLTYVDPRDDPRE